MTKDAFQRLFTINLPLKMCNFSYFLHHRAVKFSQLILNWSAEKKAERKSFEISSSTRFSPPLHNALKSPIYDCEMLTFFYRKSGWNWITIRYRKRETQKVYVHNWVLLYSLLNGSSNKHQVWGQIWFFIVDKANVRFKTSSAQL